MPAFDEFITRNRLFAADGPHPQMTAMPNNRVFVVTCLDPRVEPAAFLGIGSATPSCCATPAVGSPTRRSPTSR